MRARATEVHQRRTTLASAQSKLAAVATEAVGVSGRQLWAALAEGEEDPETLAKAGLRRTLDEREPACIGRGQPPHRLRSHASRDHRRFLERTSAQLDLAVERATAPCAPQLAARAAVPGSGAVAVAAIGAAIGVARARFPMAGHLASWAGRCPGNTPRGGRRLSSATTKGTVRRLTRRREPLGSLLIRSPAPAA